MAEVSEFIHDNSAVVEVFIEARGNVCHRVYGVISHSCVDGEKWPGLNCFLSPLLCVMLILLSWTNWYRKRALMCFIAGNAWLVACGPVGRQHKVLHGQLGQTLCYRLGIKRKTPLEMKWSLGGKKRLYGLHRSNGSNGSNYLWWWCWTKVYLLSKHFQAT